MLTKRQYKVWALIAIGLSADEIADKLCIEASTVRKHIDNVKKAIGLSKCTELGAEFICQYYGSSLGDFKKKILASVLLGFVVFTINPYYMQEVMIRNRRGQRTQTARIIRVPRRACGSLYEELPMMS